MDTHTHSIASGHAYSTISENAKWAAEQGLSAIALTDHAPAMPHTTGHAFFANLHVVPKELYGVRLFHGIELNILDYNGTVDMDNKTLSHLDIAVASLHLPCIKAGSKAENTRALLKVMENPYVDILGHPGTPHYEVDFRELVRVAAETGTILELNNASLVPGGYRHGSDICMEEILRYCMEFDVPIVVGSDAHFYTGIGDFAYAQKLLEKLRFPEELVLSTHIPKLLTGLKRNKC